MDAEPELASVLEEFQQQMKTVVRLQQERARLTATASVQEQRVTVTVNANGAVIETLFADNVSDLSYSEIAEAVTSAALEAAAEVARRSRELTEPLAEHRKRMPKLSDLVEGMPDLESLRPARVPVPTTPPNSPDRLEAETPEMEFADVEDRPGPTSGVTDKSW
ncbi:YbaB/EbfC family nucleoid-associated protein [Nocardia sp. NBC_00416]|uniref:YbaB/EbfC family nucleoid-associated protein n=1 Tax=Nocardia sp. NBC_00416 TaxID=2975991 RepID=UPI002E21970F